MWEGKLTVVFTKKLSCLYVSIICINIILTADVFAIDINNAFGIWLFDDGSGNIAKDSSPRRNNCNLMRSPKWVPGKFGTALDFGNGSHAVSRKKLGISGNAHRTVVFWFRPMKEDERQTIVAWGEKQPMKYFSVEINGPQGPKKSLFVGELRCAANTEVPIPFKKWQHVAIVFPGGIWEAEFYLDGKRLESGAHGGNLKNQCETVNAVLGIGTNLPEKAFHFTGAIDELGIFNVALTEEEIKKIMNQGLVGALAVASTNRLTSIWSVVKTQ